MYSQWENAIALTLTYLPFAILFLYAFQKSLRFSKSATYTILFISVIVRIITALYVKQISSTAVIICNYAENIIMIIFAKIAVRAKLDRMLFAGLILKNTADAIVIFSKFLEHLVTPEWADVGYHWTYSVSLAVCETLLLPFVFLFIKRYFTIEIRESIDKRWRYLWVVPLFFYLSWGYMFYYSSDMTDLEMACLPINSAYLLLSILCQHIIYACLATLVESLQNEAKLQAENHAMQLQSIQYEYMNSLIEDDRKLRHNMRHHFTVMAALIDGQEYEELADYVKRYITSSAWSSQIRYCSNNILNIMATFYANRCYSNNIDIQISLNIPERLPISDTEITILFGNLLENAFDACNEVPDSDDKKITFNGALLNNNYVFSIRNTFNNEIEKNNCGKFKSTKHDGDGIGVSSCLDIVNKHGGYIDFKHDNMFQVDILIPK